MALINQFSTNTNLSALPELDQTKFPEIYGELLKLRFALNILSGQLDFYTGALSEDPQYWSGAAPATYARLQNITRFYVKCDEAMTQGQTANLRNVAGVLTARLANATNNTKPCKAYLLTSSVAVGDFGEFILAGVNPYLSGLTPGSTYYQDKATPGGITTAAPVAAGNIEQVVGWAMSATSLWFIPQTVWIQH